MCRCSRSCGQSRHRPFSVARTVQRRDASEVGRNIGGFRKIFVATQAHSNADFWFAGFFASSPVVSGRSFDGLGLRELFLGRETGLPTIVRGVDDTQHSSPASHAHVVAKSDFGRHSQRQFDVRSFVQRHRCKQKGSARTQILRESQTFSGSRNVAQRNRKIKCEALSNTAFDTNRRNSHSHATSLGEPPWERANATLAQSGQSVKSKVPKRTPGPKSLRGKLI